MKHIIFFTLVLISAQFAKAQNVGIGTNTPYAKLHVVDGLAGMPSTMGTMAIESAASENLLQFKSTEAAKSGILFGGPSNFHKSIYCIQSFKQLWRHEYYR